MTTPPLPSSSPAPAMDIMDMSPLPHKPPYAVINEVNFKTPTITSSSNNSPVSAVRRPLQESPLEPHNRLLNE